MPKIVLKPNSAEYADSENVDKNVPCDMPGCSEHAEFRAPKHRGLNEYYNFCFKHVKEYNRAWNFFSGMSDSEVQSHMEKSMYGDRPTWQYASGDSAEDILRQKAQNAYYGDDSNSYEEQEKRQRYRQMPQHSTPETEALAIMGLEPPVQLDDIKKRYKELAKKHHPDLNGGCPKSEELLKQINMSYTILKLAYEEYDKLLQKR